jgi:hypothetical protein
MTLPDPSEDRARIAGVYSLMSDEELVQLAQSGDEFSLIAKDAFRAEIAKRGLTIEIAQPACENIFEFMETVTLRKFRDLPEALLAKGTLESAGIDAYLVDDNIIRMEWFWSNLLGGIKLKVRPEDVQSANEILNQPIPETLDFEGIENFEQPKCPRCQSLDINYEQLNRLVAYGSAYLGVPIPVHTHGWTCHSCGNRWEEPQHVDSARNDGSH